MYSSYGADSVELRLDSSAESLAESNEVESSKVDSSLGVSLESCALESRLDEACVRSFPCVVGCGGVGSRIDSPLLKLAQF